MAARTRTKARKGVRFGKPVTMEEVGKTVRQAEVLVGLAEKDPDALLEQGVPPEALAELRNASKELGEIKVPRARAMMVAALGDGMTKELVLTLYHRTIRAMHAMAPMVAMKLAEKMDDHQAPGSTRVIIEMAKGLGLFVPAEPIAAKNRMDLMDEDALREQPTEALKDRVLGGL